MSFEYISAWPQAKITPVVIICLITLLPMITRGRGILRDDVITQPCVTPKQMSPAPDNSDVTGAVREDRSMVDSNELLLYAQKNLTWGRKRPKGLISVNDDGDELMLVYRNLYSTSSDMKLEDVNRAADACTW
jgi:hypothetical protein